MTNSSFALSFTHCDLKLMPPDEVALQLRVSRAFVRLCLSAGCPSRRGHLSAAELLYWLFEHYEEVRSLCGLPVFAPIEGIRSAAKRRLKMANAVLTLLEFSASRASSLDKKNQIEAISHLVAVAADR